MSIKKSIFKRTELHNLVGKENSCVVAKQSVIDAFVWPCFMNDIKRGLWFSLYRKLTKYDNRLDGILLGYDNLKVDVSEGRFYGRFAQVVYPVSCVVFLFQPIIGLKLEGIVNKLSPGHIGCLVHQYFNVTIKRPEDESCAQWESRPIYCDDTITFWVKELDFTGEIPYIEGVLDDPKSVEKKIDNLKIEHATSSESGDEDFIAKLSQMNRDAPTWFQDPCNESSSSDNMDYYFDFPLKKKIKKEESEEDLL